MKRIRCQTCGTPLIIAEDQKTAYCPGCQKNVSLDHSDERPLQNRGSYVQFMMDYGTISDSPRNQKNKTNSHQTEQEEDLLSGLSIGFGSQNERKPESGSQEKAHARPEAKPARKQNPVLKRTQKHSVQSVKPAEPDNTEQAVKPVQALKPEQAVKPVQSVKPEQAMRSTQAVKQTQAVRPVQAMKPAQAVQPVKATKPTQAFDLDAMLNESRAIRSNQVSFSISENPQPETPVREVSLQGRVPAVWSELEEKTEGFTKMDLNISEILRFASDAFAQMDEAERAMTVPSWRAYLQAWARSCQSAFREKVKQLRQTQEKRKKKMTRRLEELSSDLNDQRLAHALDDEAYRRKLDEATAIRESAKRWSILSLSLLGVSLVLFLAGFILDDMLEGFFFYALVLEAAGVAGMGSCLGILITELYRRKSAERDLSNLAAGREESDSEQKSIMVLSQAETEILRTEIRKSTRIMDACRILLSAKNRALENAMAAAALETSSVEAADPSDSLIRALHIISQKDEEPAANDQLATLSVFSFEEEGE